MALSGHHTTAQVRYRDTLSQLVICQIYSVYKEKLRSGRGLTKWLENLSCYVHGKGKY